VPIIATSTAVPPSNGRPDRRRAVWDFVLCVDLLDASPINVYERRESDADLLAFRGTGPDSGQTEQVLPAEVRKYRISATENP
jgi:hypothetical protein